MGMIVSVMAIGSINLELKSKLWIILDGIYTIKTIHLIVVYVDRTQRQLKTLYEEKADLQQLIGKQAVELEWLKNKLDL